jgi:HD-GYP domain-containing protein (c-di-GMP phosphodiesterase class II)
MRRYLPLAALVTGLVMVLPAVLASQIVPHGSLVFIAASGLSAIALSIVLASVGAALWKRQPHSRDVVFADLLIWGWARRCWTERRLSQARELYDSARKSGPSVSIELLTGLSRVLESRDSYTHGHGQRVARHAAQIARAMHLSSVEIAKIRTAATVHDIGKLYTPREILNNPNQLTDAEFEVAKRHAAWGGRMLAGVGEPEITAMVRHHHERIDGRGYPDGLTGSEIPLGARIIAVADTFDAITSSRAYRKARTQKRALDVLAEEAGAQLDRDAVAAFRTTYSARRSVAWLAILAAAPQRILAALQSASQGLGAGAGGLASILPGVGAAGLLALSPSVHHNGLVLQTGPGAPGVAEAHRAPRLAAPVHANRSAGSAPAGPVPRRAHRIALVGPRTTSPTNVTGPAPAGPSREANAPTAESPGSGTSPGPIEGVLRPSPPPVPAPEHKPPVVEVPPVEPPPVKSPVPLPVETPSVNPPPLKVPEVGLKPIIGATGVSLPTSG